MGTRLSLPSLTTVPADHPHAYGDKFTSVKVCFADGGSSPRVWGQEDTQITAISDRGIIPTRMGTSGYAVNALKKPKDHPHAYGDKDTDVYNIRV